MISQSLVRAHQKAFKIVTKDFCGKLCRRFVITETPSFIFRIALPIVLLEIEFFIR